jgi:phenylacetate-CoA ligase
MAKAAIYWLLRRFAGRGRIEKLCRVIGSRPTAELNAESLVAILEFCRNKNRYYRDLLHAETITPSVLQELPPLNKEIIHRRFNDLTSEGTGLATHVNSSGGSTGLPQSFLQDTEYDNWSAATELRYFRDFHDIDPHRVRKVVLWGSERDTFKQRNFRARLSNWLSNTVFLNTFNVTEQDWLRYIKTINDYRPHFIKGYAGSLYEIARLINRRKLAVHRPAFVYSSAEMLRDFMRREIETAFATKVYDFYGSREVGPISGECQAGRRHIFVFNNHVEIVDDAGKTMSAGEVGRILITNLHNYSMPLLRYDIGDTGSISSEPCPCGSDLPYFIELKGRTTDHFKRRDGTLIHGEYFTHLFYFRPWVKEFQVNQSAVDQVEIYVVKYSEPSSADVQDIEAKIRLVMGDDCRITWGFVDEIPRTPQGKHLFTRSRIS